MSLGDTSAMETQPAGIAKGVWLAVDTPTAVWRTKTRQKTNGKPQPRWCMKPIGLQWMPQLLPQSGERMHDGKPSREKVPNGDWPPLDAATVAPA